MKSFSITDVGMKRQINQDYIYCEENAIGSLPNLFIVADGMGGHNAGDYASKYSVEYVIREIKENHFKTPIGILENAIHKAGDALLSEAKEKDGLEGMGTTFVAAVVYDKTMYVANIGDSRLYVIHKDRIKQITEDHSLVEEMIKTGEIERKDSRHHPNKNIITRALGTQKYISPDYFEVSIKKGDLILMCSDGLSNMLDDMEMLNIIKESGDDIAHAGHKLVEKANEYGGNDNIAVILIKPFDQ